MIACDFKEKAARGEERVRWLEGVREVLLEVAARGEVGHTTSLHPTTLLLSTSPSLHIILPFNFLP